MTQDSICAYKKSQTIQLQFKIIKLDPSLHESLIII